MRKIYWYDIIWVTVLALVPFVLAGCVSEGAAFGLGAGSLHETVMTEKKTNTQPVYGPPQIIYRIDDNRYFTLENYTRCEDGQTFYNNKAKGIHVKIFEGSGYLYKGRLFWLSTRDDYLAFPATENTKHAPCMGSDKGCMNAVIVTTDGGEKLNGVPYGGYTQDPTGNTKDYDMLVTNNGFYLIYYRGKNRVYPVVNKWNFNPKNASRVTSSDHEYELFRPGEQVPIGGFYKIVVSRFNPTNGVTITQCDRTLEPVQSSGRQIQ